MLYTKILCVAFCLGFIAGAAEPLSLTQKDVEALESFLNAFAKGLPKYAKGKIPSRINFKKGYCKDLKLLKLDPPLVKLTRINGHTLRLQTLNGLAEGEGYCKVCKKFLWVKVCAKAKPLLRVSNIRLNMVLRLVSPAGQPKLSLQEKCNLNTDLKIVKMRGKNVVGKIAGLFKRRISRKAEEKAEEFGCKAVTKSIHKANKKLCQIVDCN